jgi:Sugar (and other) transporter.
VLIEELADPRYRGSIVCSTLTSVSLGIIIISCLGAFLHWRVASGLAAALSLLSSIMFLFVDESPTWLMRKNKKQKAEKVLKHLWGPGKDIEVMMNHMYF